jgi:hypothetical protein
MRGRPVYDAFGLEISLHCNLAPHPDTRGDIVNMLLDVSRDVVFLAGDVLMTASTMLPEVKLGDEKIFSLMYLRIELNPL